MKVIAPAPFQSTQETLFKGCIAAPPISYLEIKPDPSPVIGTKAKDCACRPYKLSFLINECDIFSFLMD